MASKKLTVAQRREFQKDMSALKKAGLLPKNVDVRKIPASKHYIGLSRKFEGVISGRDVTVKVPRGQGASYGGKFSRRGDTVVLPKPQLGGRARYNVKRGEIVMRAKVRGGTVEGVYRRMGNDDLRAFEGDDVSFVIYLPRGDHYEALRASTVDELQRVFPDSLGNFADWLKYVNVEKFTEDDFDEEYGDGWIDTAPRVPPKRPKRKRVNSKGRNK